MSDFFSKHSKQHAIQYSVHQMTICILKIVESVLFYITINPIMCGTKRPVSSVTNSRKNIDFIDVYHSWGSPETQIVNHLYIRVMLSSDNTSGTQSVNYSSRLPQWSHQSMTMVISCEFKSTIAEPTIKRKHLDKHLSCVRISALQTSCCRYQTWKWIRHVTGPAPSAISRHNVSRVICRKQSRGQTCAVSISTAFLLTEENLS